MPGGGNFPLLQLFRAGGGVFCVLELDDHGAAFEAAAGVILPPKHMNGGDVPAWNKQPTAGFVAFVVKEHLLGLVSQNNRLLAGHRMPMHGYHRVRFYSIEHALRIIIYAVAQIIALAQTGICLRLLRK